ncbi:homeobox protein LUMINIDEPENDENS [Ipomoea triloba]|uniref:homeobox protein LUMINIDEPENDENS n=1 Tax=Ipomoea triloba TaxID=35885 RepID=UPI00125D1AA8|nr:homeobox protein LUMINIDEPENDENS [Ipomoea triloba]
MENQLQLVVSSPATSFHDLLASQRELFRSQVDHLENIVVTQCKLTGVNPLSQEMAAGALSIKIGKRPRDLLNPKAVKYMQSVFSIKDVISKKETREISALFGVTATQVRDFFTTQRTRVRKLVRLSREKARKPSASDEPCGGIPLSSDASLPVDPVPLDSVAPTNVEGPSCSTQDEALSGVEESDKDFIDNIFILMRQEETFSGQVKLMDWILEIQNPSVLQWFLSKGGVMILATWLSQAATEEQTSVLHHILKVLCHLPLHKALPAHMSAILQSVNKLRFYRTSDISNRARILLFRWSKKLANQSSKKPNGLKSASDTQDEMLLKHSIGEVMAEVDGFEESLSQFDTSENLRKLGSTQPLKLLTSSAEESNKKTGRGALSAQTRERRKVQLVEQPGQRMPGRNPQVARTASATQGRPLSADDIQKAKLRAQFLQSKYGKSKTSTDHSPQTKPEGPNKNAAPQDGVFHSTTKTYDLPTINEEKSKINEVKPKIDVEKPAIDEEKPKFDEQKKIADIKSNISNQQETPLNQKRSLDAEEPPPGKKCKAIQIPWHTPPEMVISEKWKICTGGNSKEVEVQKNRIHRERETIYRTLHEIPLNPKEPWDREMDYDDTLTPQIPTEQLPDGDGVETMVSQAENVETIAAPSASSLPQNVNSSMPEPDLELLAVLLKNPELVFALTSGQAGNLSSEDTVKLLDMIKANGLKSMSDPNGLGRRAEDKVEVSLPSPTPSSNPGTSGLKSDEYEKNPFSRRDATVTPAQQPHYPAMAAQQLLTPQFAQQRESAMLQATGRNYHEHHPSPLIPSLNQAAPSISMNASELLVNRNGAMFSSASPSPMGILKPSSMHVIDAPMPSRVQTQPQAYYVPEPLPPQSWGGARQGLHSHSTPTNSNNYNPHVGATTQPGPWRRNDYGFESFSPENSPARSHEYASRWNHSEPRMNNYPTERMTPRNPSTYHDPNWNVNRRWSDRRR